MAILSEAIYQGDILKLEIGEASLLSRETILLASGQNLAIGTVLGGTSIGAASSAAKGGGNTGNGTLVLDATTPVLANATTGVYTVTAVTAGANSATFRVTNPLGAELGEVSFSGSGASATFSDRIKFVITDGSTDFIVGDSFNVTVAIPTAAASYLGQKYVAFSPAALDGSQNAVGILLYTTNATSADTRTEMVARQAVIASNRLVWPGGITAPQQAAAVAQLAALGITLRTGV